MTSLQDFTPEDPFSQEIRVPLTPAPKPASQTKESEMEQKVSSEALKLFEQETFVTTPASLDIQAKPIKYEVEPEKEPDYPDEEFTVLDNLTDDELKSTLFESHNLLIFENTYKGKLPNNGILQSDFNKLIDLKDQLDTPISAPGDLFTYNGNHAFRMGMSSLLKCLMLTSYGRTVLIGLINRNLNIQIKDVKDNTETALNYIDEKPGFCLEFNLQKANQIHTIGLNLKSGGKILIKSTPAAVLFHELCHALIEKNLDTFGHSYDALPLSLRSFQSEEEFRVICGMTVDQYKELMQQPDEPAKLAEYERIKGISAEVLRKEFITYDHQMSSDIPVFENIMNFLFFKAIRFDHNTTIFKPANLKISKHQATKEIYEYFLGISRHGFVSEIKEFFAINRDLAHVKFQDQYIISKVLLNITSEDNLEGFKCLVKSGIIPLSFHLDQRGGGQANLIEFAMANGAMDIVKYLFSLSEMHQYAFKINFKGENLIHLLIANCKSSSAKYEEMMKLLLQFGINPNQKSKDGNSAVDLVIKQRLYDLLAILIGSFSSGRYLDSIQKVMVSGDSDALGIFLNNLPLDKPTEHLERIMQNALLTGNKKIIQQVFDFAVDYNGKHGVNVFLLKNPDKQSLLHLMLHNKLLSLEEKTEIAVYLMDHGVSLEDKDKNDHTFLDLCTMTQVESIMKYETKRKGSVVP